MAAVLLVTTLNTYRACWSVQSTWCIIGKELGAGEHHELGKDFLVSKRSENPFHWMALVSRMKREGGKLRTTRDARSSKYSPSQIVLFPAKRAQVL